MLRDVDLLVCRYYAICEQLVNTDAVAELLVSDVEGSKKIIRYLEGFLDFIIRTHQAVTFLVLSKMFYCNIWFSMLQEVWQPTL